MNKKQSLTACDIALGEVLRWDVYDANENLLLRKGFIVASVRQLEALLERGLFVDAEEYAKSQPGRENASDNQSEKPSALRSISQAHEKLAQLIGEFPTRLAECGLPSRIHEIAGLIQNAISINPDLTLSSMLFMQKSEGYAIRHSIDAAIISYMLGRSLQRSEPDSIAIACAALTMNISMLPLQETLQNREGGITEDESALIRQHPEKSVEMLLTAGVKDDEWLSCVLHHHENVDGSGYPSGKTDSEISENAKIISLSDRYTSMLSPRRFRKAILPNEALRNILLDRGKGVDAVLAAHFIRIMGVYPPGTFVKLRSGEIAVISHRGKNNAAPIAHALIGPFGAPLPYPHKRETNHDRYEIREAMHADQIEIPFNMQQIWGIEGST